MSTFQHCCKSIIISSWQAKPHLSFKKWDDGDFGLSIFGKQKMGAVDVLMLLWLLRREEMHFGILLGCFFFKIPFCAVDPRKPFYPFTIHLKNGLKMRFYNLLGTMVTKVFWTFPIQYLFVIVLACCCFCV